MVAAGAAVMVGSSLSCCGGCHRGDQESSSDDGAGGANVGHRVPLLLHHLPLVTFYIIVNLTVFGNRKPSKSSPAHTS